MSSLRPSRFRTPAGGADPSLEDAMGLSPTAVSGKNSSSPAGGIWRQKINNSSKDDAKKSLSVISAGTAADADANANAEKEGKDDGAETRQCLSPRHISSRHLSDGANLDHPFDEAANGSSSQRPTSLPSAVRSGLKLGNEIKSTDEATFEEDDTTAAGAGEEEEARDDPDMLEGEESAVSTLAVSVDTYLDEVKAPKEGEEEAAAADATGETPSPRKTKKNSGSNKKKGKKGKKSKGKKGGKSKAIATAAAGGTAPTGLTADNLAGFDEAPSDEEVDDAYFSLSNSLSGFSSVTGASDLDADDAAAAAASVAATTPKQGTSTPINSQAALRLSLWRDRDTVILSQTSPTKSRAATAATAAADVIVANQKHAGASAGAGGPESMRPKSQGELLLPSLCSGAASVQDESVIDQASSTVSSIMARGTATPRGHKSSSKYTFEAAGNSTEGGVKKEVSFTQVRDAMRRFLSTPPKADQDSAANDGIPSSSAAATNEASPSELQAAFWSKCAVLAATAVMATAKTANNRVQIAQAAAETVLSKCPKGENAPITDEDWRIAAAEGMEDLAAEVSSAIIAVGSQGGNIPTATTAAASAAAVVLLNQKEALQIPTAESPTEKVAAAVANAAPSVIQEPPKPVVHATTPVEEETATEEPKEDVEKSPKRAVEEDMIESWRKEDNNDEPELLSVGDDGDAVPSSEEKAEEKEDVAETTEPKPKDVADKPTEGDVPTVEAEKEAEPSATPADEEWINIDKALSESTEAPREDKTLGEKIAVTVAAASVAVASVAASAASSAAATTVEACCSPTEATSTKEGAMEVETSNENKGETVEVANTTATEDEAEAAPEDETLGSKIALGIATASAAAAATAIACCSPTEAATSEKTEDANAESKSVPTPAVDIEAKPASAEAEPVAKEVAATSDEAVLEVSEETKMAIATVEESAKEITVDAEPEAKEEVKIQATAQDETSVTTEPSSNATTAIVESEEQPVEEEKPADDITSDAEEKGSIDEPHATAEVSTKSKNTQLLEDLDNKQKERNAKIDKLRDFEVYLASVTSCASNEEEEGKKDLVTETEDVAKIEAATEETIASSEPESASAEAEAEAEAVIISSESEGETEVSLSGSDIAAKQNKTADEPVMEVEKTADIEIKTPTMEDATSTVKSNGTEDEKLIGAVASAEKTLTFASAEETICDTLQEAPTTDEGCAVNFSNTVKEGLEVFAATVVASCMPTPDVAGDDKSEDSAEKETKESAEEESKEVAEETEESTKGITTKEESEEVNEQPAVEGQSVLKLEPAPSEATADSAVGEKLAEIDESSVESAKDEEKKEDYPAESIEIVDEAAQLPVAKEAAIEAEADAVAVQPTPAKKATTGKKKFSSVKKIFKKKGKKV